MINNQLEAYVKQQLALSVPKETISSNLKSAGWNNNDISEVFEAVGYVEKPAPAPVQTPPPAQPYTPTQKPATVMTPVTPVIPATPAFTSPISNPVTPTVTPKVLESTSPSVSPTLVTTQQAEFAKNAQAMMRSKASSTSSPSTPHQPFFTRGKKIFFSIIVLVLLGVAGVGAYAYYSGAFIQLPVLFSQAIDSARSTTTGSYDTTFSFDLSGLTNSTSQFLPSGFNSKQFSITAKGLYDVTDTNNIKNSLTISANSGTFAMTVGLILANNTFYANLAKAPVAMSMFLPSLSTYTNKWYSFPFKSSDGQIASNPLGYISPVNTTIIEKLTPEQKAYIYNLSKNAHFIKSVQRLSLDNIGGDSTYSFIFDLDHEGIIAYLQALKDYVNTIGKDDSALSLFDPTSIGKGLDELKDFKGQIWIGRDNKLIHKIVVNFGIQPDKTKDEQIKVSMASIMSGWNQPVSIVAPLESTPFSDLMSGLIGDAQKDAQMKGKDASIKANLAMLRAQAELYYDGHKNSYAGFCVSKELKSIQKAIESSGGTGFVCKDIAGAYAVSSKLSAGDTAWCVDSTGVSKATAKTSSSIVCPAQ